MTLSLKLNVVAVIVSYQPDLLLLEKLLVRLAPQVDAVVVVDNGSQLNRKPDSALQLAHASEIILLGDNLGIAHAQNVGIKWARDKEAIHVLLMDQDSIPDEDMVSKLLAALAVLQKAGRNVACVGPSYVDSRHASISPFVRMEGLKFRRIPCEDRAQLISVDFLIASGCLIPVSVLDIVGNMRAELFIDYVDIEWGLRAREHGYQSFGVCATNMLHNLGDQPINFFGRKIPNHSPLRGYYRYRNAVFLMKQSFVSNSWRFADTKRLVLRYVFFTLFSGARFEHFKMMNLGLWHGLLGRMGKLRIPLKRDT